MTKPELIDLCRDNSNSGGRVLLKAQPFYKSHSPTSKYYHRVRSARQHHIGNGESAMWRPHVAIHFWCGGSGYLSNNYHGKPKGALHSYIPEDGVLCATCEGRAIGAGKTGVRTINGRKVMYSPRKCDGDL